MINDLWYKNAVIYCLSVGTYMDANGDGIGDFQGLMRRLDYLHGLGMTAIWLMPFQTSPCRDDGYDVADYYNVDPRLRHARRFRRVHPRRQTTRHSCPDRSGGQSHLRSASMVQAGALRSKFEISRLVRLVEEEAAARRTREWCFREFKNRPGIMIAKRKRVVFPPIL